MLILQLQLDLLVTFFTKIGGSQQIFQQGVLLGSLGRKVYFHFPERA